MKKTTRATAGNSCDQEGSSVLLNISKQSTFINRPEEYISLTSMYLKNLISLYVDTVLMG